MAGAYSFAYNTLGNVRKETTPLHFITLSFVDDVGRDILVITPRGTGTSTDSTQLLTKGVRQRTVFDNMSRTPWP